MEETQNPITSPNLGGAGSYLPPVKKTGRIIKISAGVILALLLIASVSLASRIWDPIWNPFRPNPEKSIKKAIIKNFELKSLHGSVSFSAAGESAEQKVFLSGKTEGDSEIIDSSFNFDGGMEFNITTQASGNILIPGVQIAMKVDLKKIGDVQYFKINSFPLVFSMFLPSQIAIDFENKWVKVDSESYKKIIELAQSSGENVSVVVPLDEMTEKWKDIQKNLGERIMNILKDKQFYSADKKLPDEKIEGQKTYHYQVSLKPAETAEVIIDVLKAVEEEMLKSFGTGPAYLEPAEMKKKIEEAFNKIGGISAEIWIGKKDGYIYRIKFSKDIDLNKFAPIVGKIPNSYDSVKSAEPIIKLNIEANYSKFDQAVKINLPGESKPIEDIILPFIEESMKDSAITSNLSYIGSKMSSNYYKNKSYLGITCKNSLISFYCAELKKITGKEPIVRASKNYYCAYSELFSKEDGKIKYVCYGNYNYGVYKGTINPGLKGYCDGKTFMCPTSSSPGIIY